MTGSMEMTMIKTLKEDLVAMLRSNGWSENCEWVRKLTDFIEQREEAERERVKAALSKWMQRSMTSGEVIGQVYPPHIYPPKVKVLPAGWYAVKRTDGLEMPFSSNQEFEPWKDCQYIPIKNPFEEESK